MTLSTAKTVAAYLKELPAQRRTVVSEVRRIALKNLYLALGARKQYYGLCAMSIYSVPGLEKWLRGEFRKAGKKLDMGKCCIRFRKIEDLPVGAIEKLVGATSVKKFIAVYKAGRK